MGTILQRGRPHASYASILWIKLNLPYSSPPQVQPYCSAVQYDQRYRYIPFSQVQQKPTAMNVVAYPSDSPAECYRVMVVRERSIIDILSLGLVNSFALTFTGLSLTGVKTDIIPDVRPFVRCWTPPFCTDVDMKSRGTMPMDFTYTVST